LPGSQLSNRSNVTPAAAAAAAAGQEETKD